MLEKIFTSRNRIKILKFLLFEKEKSYIREISRKLKISVSATKTEIDNLKSIDLIKADENRVYLNKNCNFLGDLRNIFIKTDFIVYPLRNILEDKKIRFALVFGSFASGDYKEESDVDLFIVGDIKLSEIYKLLKPLEESTEREINPVVWTIENLRKEKNSGFARDVFKKKIVMIKGEENELRKIIK